MTRREKIHRAYVAQEKARILAGKLIIDSDSNHPIAVDPFNEERPFITREPVTFIMGPHRIDVPAGFVFDGASVPAIVTLVRWLAALVLLHFLRPATAGRFWARLMQPLNTINGHLYPALLHDWLYRTQTLDRELADAMYRSALVRCGVSKWVARAEHVALELFGGRAWAAHGKGKP